MISSPRYNPVLPSQLHNKKIAVFTVLSIGLHLAVLVQWSPHTHFELGGHQQNSPSIAISLAAPELKNPIKETTLPQTATLETVPQKSTPTKSRIEAAPPRKELVTPKPVQKEAPTTVTTIKPVVSDTPTIPSATPSTTSEVQSRAMVRRLIQTEIGNHFHYPRLAQRKGWQGKVQLEFIVQPTGLLSDIKIKKGARYGVLNRSAVQTMTRIHQLTRVDPGALTAPIRMELPIIYQLQ